MRHQKLLHQSFAGGEISPDMFSRVEDPRFRNGAALISNMICKPQGAIMRRPGTQFIRKVRDSSAKVRLLPFTFANGDTFAIEIGRATIDSREIGYFRFHTKGGTLLFDKPRDYVAEQAVTTTSSAENVRVGPVAITHIAANPSSNGSASITATSGTPFSAVVPGDIVVVGSSTGVVYSANSSVITLTTAGWSPARPEPVATSATVYNSITGNNLPVIFTTSAPHQLLTGDPVVFTVNDGFIDTSSISGINVCSAGSTLRLALTAIVSTASNVRVPAVGSIPINAPTATTITATSSGAFGSTVVAGDVVVVPNTINGVAGNSTGIVLSVTNSVLITLTPAGWSPLGVTPNGTSATVYFPMTITAASGTPFATSSVLPGDIVVVSNGSNSSNGIVASVSSSGSVITLTPPSWFSALVGGSSATIYSPPSNNTILWTSQESSKILHGDQVVIGAETMPTYGDKQLERDRIYYAYNDFGWTGKASANGNIKTITSNNISPAIVNNAAVGRKLIITSGLLNGSETEITSNTTSTITFTAFGSTYSGTYDYPGGSSNPLAYLFHRTGQIISSNITPPLPSGILNGKGHRIYFPGFGYYAEILSNDNILNGTTAYSRITFVPLWFGASAANGIIFQIIPVISKSDTFLIGANKNTFGISETKFGTPLNFNSNVVYNLTTTTSSTPSNIFFNVSSEIPHPEVDGLLTDKNYKVLITSGPLFGIERLITSSSFYTVNSIVVSRIDVYPPFSLTVGGAVTSVGAGITFVIVPPVSVAPVRQPIKVNNTYYVNKQSDNTFAVSTTKDKALVGDTLASNVGAINPAYQLRMHYDYRAGDLAYLPSLLIGSFSCMRIPWGSSENNGYCYKDDHIGHPPPANDTYWCRVAGLNGTDKRGQQILVTCDPSTDRITCSGHGLDNGEPVIINFTNSPSVGSIAEGAVLYVRNKGTNDFEVSATAFGPKINLTSAGSNVKIFCAPYYDVPHYYSASDIAELTTTQSNNVLSIACRNKPFSELKRINAGRWEHSEVKFISNVLAPTNFGCRLSEFSETLPRGVQGQGNQVSVTNATTPTLTTISAHSIGLDEPVYVFGLSTYGIPDGDYVTSSALPASPTTINLMELLSGKPVVPTSLGSLFGYVQPTLAAINISNSYVVTAIDSNGIESNPSAAVVVKNNMFVAGAYNPFAWSEVTGASLYRIYKNVNGLYGVIGEVTGTTFKDDNIAADYAVSPPILDNSLLSKTNVVSWNSATNIVTVDKQAPPEGSPVIFETNKTIPTNIKEGITYYAYNSVGSTFQLVATPGSATPLLLGGSVTGQAICKTGYFPGAVSYFEGRRVFGGSLMLPQDVWMTASGTESDLSYSLPTVDSDRIRFRIALREAAIVLHLMPMSHLLMLTNSGEIRLTPINSDSITPNSVSVRPQSYVGSGISSPVIVNNIVVYAAARGGHVRELGFKQDEAGYQSGNLSLRTSHLFDDYSIVQMAYQKAPLSTVWCVSSSGKLLGITYLPEEQLGAWHQHSTDGTFESIVALPEGKEDSIYLSVKRGDTRYIERMAQQEVTSLADTFFMDCGVAYDGAATTEIIGLEHLNGKAVDYVADGVVGSGLVANGQLTLAKAAAKVRVGLPFTAQVVSIPIVMQTQPDTASASGREKNINKAWVRVYESGQFRMGPVLETPTLTAAAQVNSRTLNSGLLTGLEPITLTGSWSDEGQIMIQSKGANPLTVVGITFEVATGG